MARAKPDLITRVTRRLAEIRREHEITQEVLAERLEIPVQHVRRVEAGQNITLETLERWATALGVSIEVAFEVDPRGPRKPRRSRRQRAMARKKLRYPHETA